MIASYIWFSRVPVGVFFKNLSDENIPVIKELANILAGYYITTLDNLFGTKYSWSDPFISVNPYRAIEDFDLGQVYIEEVRVLVFKSSFHIPDESIKEDVFLIFKKDNIPKILEFLSEKLKLSM